MPVGGQRRATLSETIGAWLGIWTPSRDVVIPPVPVRALAIGAVLLALVVAGAAAVIVPRIDESKERRAAAEARERAAQREAARLETIREQRPRRVVAAGLREPSGAPAARRVGARESLLARAEAAITADARERAAAGELSSRPGATECEPYPPRAPGAGPERDLSARRGVYNCLVLVREIAETETNVGGKLGYPFRAVLDFERFSITWCKTNPVPGEQVIPDPRTVVELPRACRAAR